MSIGLFEAATVTGSAAMPVTEPGPDGTCSAYAAHPVPMRAAAGAAGAPVIAGAAEVVVSTAAEDVAEVSDDSVVLSLEQAATPKIATAARPATATDFR